MTQSGSHARPDGARTLTGGIGARSCDLVPRSGIIASRTDSGIARSNELMTRSAVPLCLAHCVSPRREAALDGSQGEDHTFAASPAHLGGREFPSEWHA